MSSSLPHNQTSSGSSKPGREHEPTAGERLSADERLADLDVLDSLYRDIEITRPQENELEAVRDEALQKLQKDASRAGGSARLAVAWPGLRDLRLALGLMETRRRVMADLERELWRQPPQDRSDTLATRLESLRTQDMLRLRSLRDEGLVQRELARKLWNDLRTRPELATGKPLRLDAFTPVELTVRYVIAVIECRRRLGADMWRSAHPPKYALKARASGASGTGGSRPSSGAGVQMPWKSDLERMARRAIALFDKECPRPVFGEDQDDEAPSDRPGDTPPGAATPDRAEDTGSAPAPAAPVRGARRRKRKRDRAMKRRRAGIGRKKEQPPQSFEQKLAALNREIEDHKHQQGLLALWSAQAGPTIPDSHPPP